MVFINFKFLAIKVHYFLFYGGSSVMMLFGSTIARQRGYTASTVGVAYTLISTCAILATILYSWLADKFEIKRFMFLFAIFMGFISNLMMIFVPSQNMNLKEIVTMCDNSTNRAQICDTSIDDIISTFNKTEAGDRTCQFTCDRSDRLEEEMCKSWGMLRYCNVQNSSTEKFNSSEIARESNFISYLAVISISNSSMLSRNAMNESGCTTVDISNIRDDGKPYSGVCKDEIKTSCTVKCNDQSWTDVFTEHVGNVITEKSFWLFFIPLALVVIHTAANVGMSDVICLDVLGDQKHLFGRQRLYGTISTGTIAVLSGALVDYFSEGCSSQKNYIPLYILGAGLFLADFVASSKLKIRQEKNCKTMKQDMGRACCDLQIIVFAIFCLFVGLCNALMMQYFFWHLENLANAEEEQSIKILEGMTVLIGAALGELPFYFCSDKILKGSHTRGISIVLGGTGLQFILYSLLVRPKWVLPIELLTGITRGTFVCTMASYSRAVAPKGLETFMQGFFCSFFALGLASGGMITGIIFQIYKGLSFRIVGSISLLMLLLFTAFNNVIYPKRKKVLQNNIILTRTVDDPPSAS